MSGSVSLTGYYGVQGSGDAGNGTFNRPAQNFPWSVSSRTDGDIPPHLRNKMTSNHSREWGEGLPGPLFNVSVGRPQTAENQPHIAELQHTRNETARSPVAIKNAILSQCSERKRVEGIAKACNLEREVAMRHVRDLCLQKQLISLCPNLELFNPNQEFIRLSSKRSFERGELPLSKRQKSNTPIQLHGRADILSPEATGLSGINQIMHSLFPKAVANIPSLQFHDISENFPPVVENKKVERTEDEVFDFYQVPEHLRSDLRRIRVKENSKADLQQIILGLCNSRVYECSELTEVVNRVRATVQSTIHDLLARNEGVERLVGCDEHLGIHAGAFSYYQTFKTESYGVSPPSLIDASPPHVGSIKIPPEMLANGFEQPPKASVKSKKVIAWHYKNISDVRKKSGK